MDRIIILGFLMLFTQCLFGQSRDMMMNQGDKAYRAENYNLALQHYEESDIKRPDPISAFNQANALFGQEKLEEAITLWTRASSSEDKSIQSSALHNLGNAYMNSQKKEEAINAYKQALRINPNDDDTRRNLALAQNMQEQQKENKENQEGSDEENQDSESQDQNEKEDQQEENQDSESHDSESQDSKNQDSQDQQNEEQQQQEQSANKGNKESLSDQQAKKMTKQELLQLLKILEDEDKKVQQKAAIRQSNGKKRDKQW